MSIVAVHGPSTWGAPRPGEVPVLVSLGEWDLTAIGTLLDPGFATWHPVADTDGASSGIPGWRNLMAQQTDKNGTSVNFRNHSLMEITGPDGFKAVLANTAANAAGGGVHTVFGTAVSLVGTYPETGLLTIMVSAPPSS